MSNNLRTRAGIAPAKTNGGDPFEITTIDAETFLTEKLQQIAQRSNDIDNDIKISLITLTIGKKFKPFVALLPLSVLKGSRKNDDEELSIFNPNSQSGVIKIKDPVYKFLILYMFNKSDGKMFFNRDWRSALGISETNSRKLASLRLPQTIEVGNRKYVLVLMNPINVFHDMLVNLDNPTERFAVKDVSGEKIDDKNYRYSMLRSTKNAKKNRKDEINIASEINKKLGNR